MTYGKTKMNSKNVKPWPRSWDEIRDLPLTLIFTAQGPLIGGRCRQAGGALRLYVPARLEMPTPQNVVYMPLAFVEQYLEITPSLVFGSTPPPNVIVQGYQGYFNEFVKGGYKMNPVVAVAGVEGQAHEVPA